MNLVALPKLETFKVLNVLGIACDLIGAALLSRLVTENARYQQFVVDQLAWHMGVLFYAGLSGLAFQLEYSPGPSTVALKALFTPVWILFSILILVEVSVVMNEEVTKATRANIFGALYLFTGLVLQLIAAIMDLQDLS